MKVFEHSPIVACVGLDSNDSFQSNTVRLWNIQKDVMLCELTPSTSPILSVHLCRSRMVFVTSKAAFIYDVKSMQCLQTLETSSNPLGVATLSTK